MSHQRTSTLLHFFCIQVRLKSISCLFLSPYAVQLLGYSASDALLRPASVSHTIRLPARAQNQPLPVDVPYPNAFKRAKEYLKKILRDEAEYYKANPTMPQSPIGQIICKLGEKAVVDKFRTQILAYARRDYPFQEPKVDGEGETGNVLTWWRDLSSHPLAQVLAVSAPHLRHRDCATVIEILSIYYSFLLPRSFQHL